MVLILLYHRLLVQITICIHNFVLRSFESLLPLSFLDLINKDAEHLMFTQCATVFGVFNKKIKKILQWLKGNSCLSFVKTTNYKINWKQGENI